MQIPLPIGTGGVEDRQVGHIRPARRGCREGVAARVLGRHVGARHDLITVWNGLQQGLVEAQRRVGDVVVAAGIRQEQRGLPRGADQERRSTATCSP